MPRITSQIDPQSVSFQDNRAAMLARGLAPEFVARVFRTDPDDIWFPSRTELLAAGVITSPASTP